MNLIIKVGAVAAVAATLFFTKEKWMPVTPASSANPAKTERPSGGAERPSEGVASVPATAQARAVKLYPELGKAGTPLNHEFLSRAHTYRAEQPKFFDDPEWPTKLARECSIDLAIKTRRR